MEKRQREKLVFDASAYLLFEATGDSDFAAGEKEEEYSGAADDDAESTSYGLFRGRRNMKDDVDMLHYKDHQFRKEAVEEEEDDEEEEGVVDQCRCRVGDNNKNSKCDDQSKLILNDRQSRDRRFWEACLAS